LSQLPGSTGTAQTPAFNSLFQGIRLVNAREGISKWRLDLSIIIEAASQCSYWHVVPLVHDLIPALEVCSMPLAAGRFQTGSCTHRI
jgi:hypothetical protein